MKCWQCENEARAACVFCGRFVCKEHAKAMPTFIAMFLGGANTPKGLAVANAILLVAFAEQYRRQGHSAEEAGRLGARSRIRAIAMKNRAREVRQAHTEAERLLLWKSRKQAFGAVGRLAPSYCTQDGVVPRTKLPETLAAVMAGLISYAGYMLMFFGGGNRENNNPLAAIGAVLAVILAPIAAALIQMAISRTREFGADRGGAHSLPGTGRSFRGACSLQHLRGNQRRL